MVQHDPFTRSWGNLFDLFCDYETFFNLLCAHETTLIGSTDSSKPSSCSAWETQVTGREAGTAYFNYFQKPMPVSITFIICYPKCKMQHRRLNDPPSGEVAVSKTKTSWYFDYKEVDCGPCDEGYHYGAYQLNSSWNEYTPRFPPHKHVSKWHINLLGNDVLTHVPWQALPGKNEEGRARGVGRAARGGPHDECECVWVSSIDPKVINLSFSHFTDMLILDNPNPGWTYVHMTLLWSFLPLMNEQMGWNPRLQERFLYIYKCWMRLFKILKKWFWNLNFIYNWKSRKLIFFRSYFF